MGSRALKLIRGGAGNSADTTSSGRRRDPPAGEPSDEALMAKVAAIADDGAFRLLYQRHRRGLYAHLWRLCSGESRIAEELMQETLERVFRSRGSFDPNRRFVAWLYTIASNVARDRHRRAKVRPRASRRDSAILSLPAPVHHDPDQVLRARRLMMALEDAIGAMPDGEREAFLLVRRGGLSYREAAAALGCSLSAVKMRVSRALGRLTQELGPYLQQQTGGEA